MAPISTTPVLLLCILLTINSIDCATHHHSAPAPAPSAAADCSSLIMNMADCLDYVSSGSTVHKPGGTCCSGLKTVLRTRAECLCEGLKSSSQMGIVLNVTKVATLPAACSLSAPSISSCGLSLSGGGVTAPVGSPTGVPGLIPNEIAPTPTQGNSASVALTAGIGSIVAGIVFLGLVV